MLETVYVGREGLGAARFFSPGFWAGAVRSDVAALIRGRFVLANMVKTQLTTRYHRSSLGFVWTLLNPLLMLVVQSVVFSQVFRINFAEFGIYMFAGFVAWQFIAAGIDQGSKSLLIHEAMLRKIALPKFMCPLAELLGGMVNLVFATGAIFVLLLVFSRLSDHLGILQAGAVSTTRAAPTTGARLGLHLQVLVFIPATVLATLFLFGVSLIGMTLLVWFRDMEHLLGVVLAALYFTIPIVYPRSAVSPQMLSVLKLNPLYHHVALYQHALALGTWPPLENWVWAASSAGLALVAGYVTYKVYEDLYIYRL